MQVQNHKTTIGSNNRRPQSGNQHNFLSQKMHSLENRYKFLENYHPTLTTLYELLNNFKKV